VESSDLGGDTIYGMQAVIYSLRIKLLELLELATRNRGRRNKFYHRCAIVNSSVSIIFFCDLFLTNQNIR